MKRCPRCSSEISVNDKVCPRCGLPVNQMEEFMKNFSLKDEAFADETEKEVPLSKKEAKRQAKAEKKAEKLAQKQALKQARKNNDTDFFKYASNSGEENPDEILETDTYSQRRKKKKKNASKPVFDIDENGEFNIGTDDVEIVGKETGKIIEQRYEQSYSIKKSRGDYIPPKIKWWEIYKLADRHFARKKIKKEVVKASKLRPSFINKTKLLLLAIFLGWTGAHNFYAGNKKKGWFSIITFAIMIAIFMLSDYNVWIFSSLEISAGGLGFINLFIWVSDVINIITNQFRYKVQKDAFIALMNVETRAKLGAKYIDMDLYHKPWWVRFKVWCSKVKKDYEENKRDRRQRNIEREKARLEQEKLAEQNENNQTEDYENIKKIVDERTIDELKTFEKDPNPQDFENNVKPIEEEPKKKNIPNYQDKYARFKNNKKSKKKKK